MKLHIGNLSKSVTDAELSELINPIAVPVTLEIVRDNAGASKGFGFADFSTDEEAKAVMAAIDGKQLGGNELKLGEARPRKSDSRPRA
jgi:cold-inducible RNA-binding protein